MTRTLLSIRWPWKRPVVISTPNIPFVLKMHWITWTECASSLPLFHSSLLFSLPSSPRVAPALFPSSLQRVCLFQLSPAQVVTPGSAGIWAKGVTRSVLESEIIPKCELSQTQTGFYAPCLFAVNDFLTTGYQKGSKGKLRSIGSPWRSWSPYRRSINDVIFTSMSSWWKDSLIFYSCLLLLPRLASAEVCFPFGPKS